MNRITDVHLAVLKRMAAGDKLCRDLSYLRNNRAYLVPAGTTKLVDGVAGRTVQLLIDTKLIRTGKRVFPLLNFELTAEGTEKAR